MKLFILPGSLNALIDVAFLVGWLLIAIAAWRQTA
jgi:uncharacterized membrane protein YgdD (TMEM256/DUF423 family)